MYQKVYLCLMMSRYNSAIKPLSIAGGLVGGEVLMPEGVGQARTPAIPVLVSCSPRTAGLEIGELKAKEIIMHEYIIFFHCIS
jgi:hypothetical protein